MTTKFSGFFRQADDRVTRPQAPIIAQDTHLDARTQAESASKRARQAQNNPSNESGGPEGLEPTRYNDWERAGRCIDF